MINSHSTRPLYDWGTDGLVIWIEELDSFGSTMANIGTVLAEVAFAIELQTGWDHRTDSHTYHPLYGYRLLLRDATGRWYAVRVGETGQFLGFIPLEELAFETVYDRVMWVE